MKSFSIVIPVYKVEQYIERCLNSVIYQKYDRSLLEIILVNDGSPDKCGEICERYAADNNIIKVYHKENGGLSDARNYGLERASNEYIMFIDSDDYIESDACAKFSETLDKYMNCIDICTGGYIMHTDSRERLTNIDEIPDVVMNGCDYLKYRLQKNQFVANAWASVYNREFLMENNLKFYKGRLHEDEEFTPRAFLKANSVAYNPNVFYHYMVRENSITTSKNKTKNAIDIFKTADSLYNIYQSLDDKDLQNLLKSHSAKICFRAIEEGLLYKRINRDLISYNVVRENCIYPKEKLKYVLLRIHPWTIHAISLLQRSLSR